ncbi:MAG: secondary thiamine-phosphate synthase enzyme YjbQ [Pseudomonadota bacterium]
MKQICDEIKLETQQPIEFVDITDRVNKALSKSNIRQGLLNVFSRHTTCAVKINERCTRLQEDMKELLEKTIPNAEYKHDKGTVDGRANGRGHLMSLMLNASETIPVVDGKLSLGNWQSVFFIELDGPRTERSIVVRLIGE